MHKRQMKKSVSGAHDLQALRPINRPDSGIEITALFPGTLPEITVCKHTSQCHPKMHVNAISRNTAALSEPKLI